MKLRLQLLAAAAFAPFASARSYETVFTFKDDFYLKFCGLSVGMGKTEGEALIDGLNSNVEAFKTTWMNEIKKLQSNQCEVVGDFPVPEFSICTWKYPDRYDTNLLPLAGECHEHGGQIDGGGSSDCYIQRLFYQVKNLKVKCPKQLPSEDLNRSALLSAALEIMIPSAVTANSNSPWNGATAGVDEVESNDACNAPLSINRYTEIDVNLKCLKEEYTTEKANLLKEALDEYFEEFAVPKIKETVESESSMSAVFGVKSPFDKDGDTLYCYFPSYYADGTLVEQYAASDGNIVTKFKCGFDLLWFKDKDFNDSLLSDLVNTVQQVFTDDDPPFLQFLQGKYQDVAWIQNTQDCDVIDPNILDPTTLKPTTAPPTLYPTTSPTKAPTSSPTQNQTAVPSESLSSSPSDSPTSNPTISPRPTSPTDTSAPSQSPTTAYPTRSPTNSPTRNPTSAPTNSPTGSPTRNPTKAPTASPVVSTIVTPSPVSGDCITATNVTEEPTPFVTEGSGTCGNGKIGDGICAGVGECCSRWGWCGFTSDYCDDTAPTDNSVDPNLGKCGFGNGVTGDGTCTGENECCSVHGYCGTGDQYCSVTINTETNESSDGKCGGGGVGEGKCFLEDHCCSEYGFCGATSDYCTGVKPRADGDINTAGSLDNSPLPDNLKPTFGFRCGKTETDARSNCKKECTHARGNNNGNGPCEDDEECWGIQLNYCNTFEEGSHPVCTDLSRANSVSRCGVDETSARGHCGKTCSADSDCDLPELCFSVMENLCDCHLENLLNSASDNMPLEGATGDVNDTFVEPLYNQEAPMNNTDNPFFKAREKIMPYFVKSVGEGTVEGRSASFQVNMSVALVVIVFLNSLFSHFM